ncbi:MAG: hypothetical protein LLF76_11640 [Planctomycetaceae bacterium]|nr:hypothetical protein [Planctomycetaceae bacterium]
MKKLSIVILSVALFAVAGCESKWGTAGLGAAGGAAAGAGAYEYKANREMKRIKEDLDAGRITQEEYNIRKDEINRMSILE